MSGRIAELTHNTAMPRLIMNRLCLFTPLFLYGVLGLNPKRIEARSVMPPPTPELHVCIRAADLIAEVRIEAGGIFSALASLQELYLSDGMKNGDVIELTGFNSYNGDTVHNGFQTGSRWILFLSRTERPAVYAPLTPLAPRLSVNAEGVLLTLGDPPFRVRVPTESMSRALRLLLAEKLKEDAAERMVVLQSLWDSQSVENRYLATALAGFLRETRALPLLKEATEAKLLRLQLTAIDALTELNSPAAIELLRTLMKAGSESVARSAAQGLIRLQAIDAMDDLLRWARKASEVQAKMAVGDRRREAPLAVLNALLVLLDDKGALVERSLVSPLLFELAKGSDREIAAKALYVLSTIADRSEINQLLELAEDPAFALKDEVRFALMRASLRAVDAEQLPRFRTWWEQAQDGLNDDYRRNAVEAASNAYFGLRLDESHESTERARTLLLASPASLGLLASSRHLLGPDGYSSLSGEQLFRWRSPLLLPFFIDRLCHPSSSERQIALEALTYLAHRHPALRELTLPFTNVLLNDSERSPRRSAMAASGRLQDFMALPMLLDVLKQYGSLESARAIQALYGITARTLGYWESEPLDELQRACGRLQGWWQTQTATGTAYLSPYQRPPIFESAAPALLEEAMQQDSRVAAAAFAALLDRCRETAIWQKLYNATRLRDRTHGLLGLLLQPGSADLFLDALPPPEGNWTATLLNPLALLGLGLQGQQAKVLNWLQSENGKASEERYPGLWRVGLLSLGFADGDAPSLKFLTEHLQRYLREEDAGDTTLLQFVSPIPQRLTATMRACLLALMQRQDGLPKLELLLNSRQEALRLTAAAALLRARHTPSYARCLQLLTRLDRSSIDAYMFLLEPALTEHELPALRAMLAGENESAAMAAAWLLAQRPAFVRNAEISGALIAATRHEDEYVRAYAAEALGVGRVREAIPALLPLLQDWPGFVKARAAEALGRIGEPESCRVVARIAAQQFNLDTRWLRAIGISGTEAAQETIQRTLRSNSWLERYFGLEALGYFSKINEGAAGKTASTQLFEEFRNPDSPFQHRAGISLTLNEAHAVELVRESIVASDRASFAQSVQILIQISTKRSAALLLQSFTATGDSARRAVLSFALCRLLDLTPNSIAPENATAEFWQKSIEAKFK